MVGVAESIAEHPVSWFRAAGDRVLVLGRDRMELGGSAYLRLLFGIEQGRPPAVDLEAEARLGELLRRAAHEGILHCAHDVAEGGLAVTLAEATFPRGLGARLELDGDPLSLFSETPGARRVVAVAPRDVERLLALAEELGVPARDVGVVGGGALEIAIGGEAPALDVQHSMSVWREAAAAHARRLAPAVLFTIASASMTLAPRTARRGRVNDGR
jgi:phosphoribosylformylglycinamidine synthase